MGMALRAKEEEVRQKQRKVLDRAEWRRYARRHLLRPSPAASAAAAASAGQGTIRVAMRTPLNANRNTHHFSPGPSTEELYIYAETLLIPESDLPQDDPDHPPAGFSPPRDFIIVTSYPRKEVPRVETGGEEAWEVVKKAGGALFAEKIEGSVWGEAERGEESEDEEE